MGRQRQENCQEAHRLAGLEGATWQRQEAQSQVEFGRKDGEGRERELPACLWPPQLHCGPHTHYTYTQSITRTDTYINKSVTFEFMQQKFMFLLQPSSLEAIGLDCGSLASSPARHRHLYSFSMPPCVFFISLASTTCLEESFSLSSSLGQVLIHWGQ